MGHQSTPSLPDTAPWRRVVEKIADGADAAAVAQATTGASLRGLEKAYGDEGLVYSAWLLIQTVLAAKQPDFAAALRLANISVPDDPEICDITSGVSEAIDRHLHAKRRRTDIGEMAQLAVVESLTVRLGQRSANLFGIGPAEVHRGAAQLATDRGFASLAHDFFARFTGWRHWPRGWTSPRTRRTSTPRTCSGPPGTARS